MKRLATTIGAAFAAAAFLLSGCSAINEITEKGGDTTCKEFNAADAAKQESAVAAMLKKKEGTEAPHLELAATKLGVQAYCKTIGKDSSKISEASLR